jgi:HPt (histidine-containing phosphotransfer) domain-containing protein
MEGKGTVHERQTASPEVFDRAQAIETTGGDEELLREIVGLFLEDCPRMVGDLDEALAARDEEAVRRAAHTLKGSVAVIGARALADAAKEVEERARAGDLTAAAAAFGRVDEELKRLAPVLEELLAG